ncbi:MAG: hypothetical protein H0U25_10260 [Thermoleophilaceae bacterium]|jgi:hypothetical protein|nr:hypothetical protein [Thermoleophilaceae bacterium]
MTPESKQSHSWVRVGATYGGVVAGAITVLVYQAGAQRGNKGGPGGDQAQAGPGWYLVWVEEPHRHYQLSTPRARAGAPAAELDQTVLAALAEAGEAIEAKLAGGGNHAGGR